MALPQVPHISHVEQKGKLLQIVWGFTDQSWTEFSDAALEINYPSTSIYQRYVTMGGIRDNKYCYLENLPLPETQNPGDINIRIWFFDYDDLQEVNYSPAPTIPQQDTVSVTEINGFPQAAQPGDSFTVEATVRNANNAMVQCDVEFTMGDGSKWADTETITLGANRQGEDNATVVTKDVTMPSQTGIENFCVDVTNLRFHIPDSSIRFPDYDSCDSILPRDDDSHPNGYTMVIDEVPDGYALVDDRFEE